MIVKENTREKEIELWRKNKFNLFPMRGKRKGADEIWKSENTKPNQVIKESENFGVCGTVEGKNGIVDLDDKEVFRPFAEKLISKKCTVIETPHG